MVPGPLRIFMTTSITSALRSSRLSRIGSLGPSYIHIGFLWAWRGAMRFRVNFFTTIAPVSPAARRANIRFTRGTIVGVSNQLASGASKSQRFRSIEDGARLARVHEEPALPVVLH